MKLLEVERSANNPDAANFVFWCPGCKCGHGVWTDHPNGTGAIWSFDGNRESPTFQPSIKISSVRKGSDYTCHLHVTNGMLVFCGDSQHEYAGKTIPMVDFDTLTQ